MMTDEEMMVMLVRIDERTKATAEDVSLLKHVVCEGNGTPALTVQTARLDERMTAVENNHSSERKSKVALFVAVITAAGGVIAAAIQYL